MRQAAGATVSQPPPLGVAVGQMSHRVADVAPVMVLQLLLLLLLPPDPRTLSL